MIIELGLVAMIAALALVVAVGCYGRIRDFEDSLKETDEILAGLLGPKKDAGPPRPDFSVELPRRPSGRLRGQPLRRGARPPSDPLWLEDESKNPAEIPTSIPEDF